MHFDTKHIVSALAGLTFLTIAMGSGEDPEERAASVDELKSGDPIDVDVKELAQMFNMGSDFTDLQRDAKEKELDGKLVEWTLEVYEVDTAGEGCFKIQTSSTDDAPGTFIKSCEADDDGIATLAPELKTGDMISVKGIVDGTSMRNFNLDPAIVTKK